MVNRLHAVAGYPDAEICPLGNRRHREAHPFKAAFIQKCACTGRHRQIAHRHINKLKDPAFPRLRLVPPGGDQILFVLCNLLSHAGSQFMIAVSQSHGKENV